MSIKYTGYTVHDSDLVSATVSLDVFTTIVEALGGPLQGACSPGPMGKRQIAAGASTAIQLSSPAENTRAVPHQTTLLLLLLDVSLSPSIIIVSPSFFLPRHPPDFAAWDVDNPHIQRLPLEA